MKISDMHRRRGSEIPGPAPWNFKSDGQIESDGINIDILPFWAVSPPLLKDLEGLGGLREPQRASKGLRGPKGVLAASEGFREPRRASMSF